MARRQTSYLGLEIAPELHKNISTIWSHSLRKHPWQQIPTILKKHDKNYFICIIKKETNW
jgi:uncharacterized protein (DUF2267 family)